MSAPCIPPNPPPCIPSNPDISGIGVRAAIYIQSLIGFIPALSALRDGEVALYEPESVETQSTTILITAFAILVSAMVQAQTLVLSNFHATIILSLSWMNNTDVFIYFLLYVQYKSQAGPQQIKPDLSSWLKLMKSWFSASVTLADSSVGDLKEKGYNSQSPDRTNPPESSESEQRSLLSAIFKVQVRGIVAILGSLHLSMMSALGIWLWRNPLLFGNARVADACAIEFASYSILGQFIPLRSNTLRIVSIVIYAVFLAPGINLLPPMILFLVIVFLYRVCHGPRRANSFHPSSPQRNLPSAHSPNAKTRPSGSRSKGVLGRSRLALQAWLYNAFLFPTIAGLILLFAINIIFIIDIELTLRHNRPLRASSESVWTFGQILAILLLVLPLRDLRVFGARRDVTASLQNAVRRHASTEVLWDLVRRRANVNVKAEGAMYPTVLLLAVSGRRDVEFIRMLLVYGADPDVRDGSGSTALHAASAYANIQIVRLLLSNGADPNVEGGDYGTALQAASSSGNMEIVRLLLERGADVNIQGGKYDTALKAAEGRGHTEIVELFRSHGAIG